MQLSPKIIDHLHTHTGPIVVAVSGGPDSMCVMSLLADHYTQQSLNLSTLHIAHYHHRQRSSSDDERDLVIQTFADCQVHVGYYGGPSSTERDLRIARHAFFHSIMDEVASTTLITGHNLTDRIETSLMNMKRGSQIKGLLNMRMIDQKLIHTQVTKPQYYDTLRPLLGYSKLDIQNHCNKKAIPYMIDESNQDISVSQRNKIRSQIITKLDKQQLQNRQDMYSRLESTQSCYPNPIRNDEQGGYDCGVVGEWSLEYLAHLFDWSGCYADMTSGRLYEWQSWIATSFQGVKYVGGWKWRIKNKKVFMGKYEY